MSEYVGERVSVEMHHTKMQANRASPSYVMFFLISWEVLLYISQPVEILHSSGFRIQDCCATYNPVNMVAVVYFSYSEITFWHEVAWLAPHLVPIGTIIVSRIQVADDTSKRRYGML